MKFLTPNQHAQLMANGKAQAPAKGTGREIDFLPVVRLFNPYGAGTWLLTEIDADDPDIAWAWPISTAGAPNSAPSACRSFPPSATHTGFS